MTPDPFEAERAALREEFFSRLFLLGGWIGGTDTAGTSITCAGVPCCGRVF